MNNESLENQVVRKPSARRGLLVVAGVLGLGVLSLYAGLRILSSASISADVEPPIPGNPFAQTSVVASATATVTSTAVLPPNPPEPGGTPKEIVVPAGWSLMSGAKLFGYDVSPITRAGIFVYSFNDPYYPTRSWIISDPNCPNQTDTFCTTSVTKKFAPSKIVGYYVYNPSQERTLSLPKVTTSTYANAEKMFARGWHLLHWSGQSATKEALLSAHQLEYPGNSALQLKDATTERFHSASIKVFVVTNEKNLSMSSIKELTGTDSATTISKIPANSFFWIYLRTTKTRVIDINNANTTNVPIVPPIPPNPGDSATSTVSGPPVPQNPS